MQQLNQDKLNLQAQLAASQTENDETKLKLKKAQDEVQSLKDYAAQAESKYAN